jgi:hypothetical protein
MTLIINNKEVEQVLTMEAVKRSYCRRKRSITDRKDF